MIADERNKKQLAVSQIFINNVARHSGYRFVTEYKFHPKRRWRLDYALPELGIAIEVEGGRYKQTTYINKSGRIVVRTGGRHNTAEGFKNDMEKYNELAALGWLLVRTTPEELLSQNTLEIVLKCINNSLFLKKKLP